jgi:hypothetical protein
MSNANVTFGGADNLVDATTDEQRALYLKMFAGEVIESFEATSIFLDKHQVRTITSGKTAQFPVVGRFPDAEYHEPGEEILGQNVPKAERTISVDKLLISHVFIDDLDDALAHFDLRGKYSSSMGQKLGLTFDNHIGREIVNAAATGPAITGEDGGLVLTDADLVSAVADTKLTAWVDALYRGAEELDNKYVTTGNRYCVLKPADYYFLVKAMSTSGFSAIHQDIGGQGSFAAGSITQIAGITLIPSTQLPVANYTAEPYHNYDCTGTAGLIFTDECVGTVKVFDISLQSEWDIRRQGTLMVARYAMGHGVLRPECAVRLASA